jgi:hypothetical protein
MMKITTENMPEIDTLCWFWQDDITARVIGRLGGKDTLNILFMNADIDRYYSNCKPVKVGEVKLEGDRK